MRWGRRLGWTRRGACALAIGLAIGLALGAPAGAEEPPPPKPVDLDRLLKLPSSVQYDVEKRGGATRTEWRARFQEARARVAEAKAKLEKAQAALEVGAANTSQWSVAPPGVEPSPDVSTNFPLTQEVKRRREDLQREEKHLRDLEVEANLADVPAEWRQEPGAP